MRLYGALLPLLLLATPVLAKPPHKFALMRYYGELLPQKFQSCHACHLTDDEIAALPADQLGAEEQPWNALGRALKEMGDAGLKQETGSALPAPLIERWQSLRAADTDGDGASNEVELIAGTSPTSAEEKPSAEQIAAAEKKLAEFAANQPTYRWQPTKPVQRPAVVASDSPWVRNPIDAFVADQHARHGLTPQPEASRAALLRRVYLDVIGLPPTRAELQAFLADESPQAYEQVVDRLLADQRHGERWGRHWMDIWRYSDWAGWGDQVRDSQPHIWRWRDWIVETLNEDRGYDEMIVAMLAADEAFPGNNEDLRATGFLVRNFKLLSREQWMLDTVDHTSRALLGVTLKCAQCHDHMYDLMSHQEYYEFRAVFEPYKVRLDPWPGVDLNSGGIARVYDAEPAAVTHLYKRGDERTPDKDRKIVPGGLSQWGGGLLTSQEIALPAESYYPALQPFAVKFVLEQAEARQASAKDALAKVPEDKPQERAVAESKLAAVTAELVALEARIAAERAKHIPPLAAEEEAQRLARVASQAERDAKVAQTFAAVAELEQELRVAEAAQESEKDQEKQQKARAELDKKLTEARKAHTSAVADAAKTDSDKYSPLGTIYPRTSSGRRLALAKWIAARENPLTARVAVNHLWSRHFGRGLVASVDDLGANGKPPSHPALLDWLAVEFMEHDWSMKHIHRLILTSQTYRLSGAYSPEQAAVDPDNTWLWRASPRRMEAEAIRDSVLYVAGALDLTRGGPEIDHQQGLTNPRRSIYFRHAPEKQMGFLQIFDAAAPTECYERRPSVIPQQALAMANSELTVREARRLARKLAAAHSESPDFITAAYEQILTRAPTTAELDTCTEFLAAQAKAYRDEPQKFGEASPQADNFAQPAAEPELRARENLVHVLFNHHEFVSIP
jgi:hypothetical protein